MTHASRGNSASEEFQGQEVLSLQDTLRCSTCESIRWHPCKSSVPYARIPLDEPARTGFFSWFTSDEFLTWPVSSYQDSYVKFLRGDLWAKVVPERTTYCAWGGPQQVPSSILSRILCSDVASWAQPSRTPKIKMAARKGHLAISPE